MHLMCYYFMLLFLDVNSYTVEVALKQGKVIGTREATVGGGRYYYAFYGVPYARRPVGALRFKDPKSAKKWKTPLDASTVYHGACAQSHIVHKHALFGNEDCLKLNIYTPIIPKEVETKLLPVAVWIHGYALTSSLSHMFGGDYLIDNYIVFITITHRVGVFGFLKVDDRSSDGNMGLKDIVMALKWIRKNVIRLGGDKRRITVMGSDSAATFLSLLLMTKSRKLFSKMVLQSGAIFSPSIFQGSYKLERSILQRNLRKMGYSDVMNAPIKEIIAASEKIYTYKEIINFQRPIVPFSPIIETFSNKSLITGTPVQFYKDVKSLNISKSILIGFNSAESITEMIPFLHNARYLNYFAPFFKYMTPFSNGCVYNYTAKQYKQIATKIKQYYFKTGISEKSINHFIRYTTDLKIYPLWKFIKRHFVVAKSKMFVYKFNYVGGFNAAKATSLNGVTLNIKGASNSDEICYILRCEPLMHKYIKSNNDTNIHDRKFISEITEMWSNFIKTGNPTPSGSRSGPVTWPAMTLKETNLLLLDNVTRLIDSKTEDDMFSFWEDIYATFYANSSCNNMLHEEL